MFDRIRNAAFGLGVIALAVGAAPIAQAAPTFSTTPVVSASGNLAFSIFDAVCTNCTTVVEVVPYQANAFLIRNAATGEPLVAGGEDLAIFFLVEGRNGFKIDRWMAQLVDAPNGSMGENLTDEDVMPGNGFGNIIISGDERGQLMFSYSTGLISGEKDINGTSGQIGALIQGLIAPVPAPASLGVLLVGLAGLAAIRRRQRAA